MEVNSFYHKTDIQLPPQLTLLGWELQRFYGPWRLWHSGVTIPQVQLTGSRSSWDSELYERTRLPFPRLLMPGIHRGDGAWQSPPCSTAYGGKVLILWMFLFPPDGCSSAQGKKPEPTHAVPLWISRVNLHTLPWLQRFCVLVCVGTHSCPFCLSRRSTLTLAKLQMLPLCLIFPETQKYVLENCSPMCLSIVWRKGKPRVSSAPSQIMVGYSQQHRQLMW